MNMMENKIKQTLGMMIAGAGLALVSSGCEEGYSSSSNVSYDENIAGLGVAMGAVAQTHPNFDEEERSFMTGIGALSQSRLNSINAGKMGTNVNVHIYQGQNQMNSIDGREVSYNSNFGVYLVEAKPYGWIDMESYLKSRKNADGREISYDSAGNCFFRVSPNRYVEEKTFLKNREKYE